MEVSKMKTMKFVLPVLVMLIAFSGCSNSTSSTPVVTTTPVTGIIIKDGSLTLTTAAVVNVTVGDQAKVLSVSVSPTDAAEVSDFLVTAASSDDSKATAVYNSAAQTLTVTPVAETADDITVTVKAKNSDNSDWVTTTFMIKVSAEGTPVVDPNIIFMWSADTDGEPTGMGDWVNGHSNNTITTFDGSSGIISGVGSQSADIPISISTAGANTIASPTPNNQIYWDDGIVLDGSQGQGTQKIISIGLATGRLPLTTAAVHPAGVFNFYDVPDNTGIRVSLTCSILAEGVNTSSANTANFRVSLNNNSQNAATTPLQPTNTYSRIFYVSPAATNGLASSGMFVKDGSGKVTGIVSNIFSPSDFTAGMDTLKTAHISISASDPTGLVGVGGTIKVTGIRIEYVTIGSVEVTINPEADFAGFPEIIALSKTASPTMTVNLNNYTAADWYVDGALMTSAASYTLDAAALKTGVHSLSVLVTVNGQLYSKSVSFTVVE